MWRLPTWGRGDHRPAPAVRQLVVAVQQVSAEVGHGVALLGTAGHDLLVPAGDHLAVLLGVLLAGRQEGHLLVQVDVRQAPGAAGAGCAVHREDAVLQPAQGGPADDGAQRAQAAAVVPAAGAEEEDAGALAPLAPGCPLAQGQPEARPRAVQHEGVPPGLGGREVEQEGVGRGVQGAGDAPHVPPGGDDEGAVAARLGLAGQPDGLLLTEGGQGQRSGALSSITGGGPLVRGQGITPGRCRSCRPAPPG